MKLNKAILSISTLCFLFGCGKKTYTISSLLDLRANQIIDTKIVRDSDGAIFYISDQQLDAYLGNILNTKINLTEVNNMKFKSNYNIVLTTNDNCFYINDYESRDGKNVFNYQVISESIYSITCRYLGENL